MESPTTPIQTNSSVIRLEVLVSYWSVSQVSPLDADAGESWKSELYINSVQKIK